MDNTAVNANYLQVRFCTNCGGGLAEGVMSCPACGEKRFTPRGAYNYRENPGAAPEAALSAKPEKAVWTFGILATAWVVLLLLQGLFQGRLVFSADVTFFIVAALLGTSTYLIVQKETKYKLYGAVAGLIAAIFSAGTYLAVLLNNRYLGKFSLADALGFGEPHYWVLFRRALLFSALTLGAAIISWYLLPQKNEKQRMFAAGVAAAGVHALGRLISWLLQYRFFIGKLDAARLFTIFSGILADALVLFLAVRFIYSLCRAQRSRIQLFGLGKAWAWVAMIGMFLSFGIVLSHAFSKSAGITYTASLLQAVAGAVGYILLLCGCRSGLFVIVAAATLVLGGQLCGSLFGLIKGIPYFVSLFWGSIFGAVNPLLACLAVRAAGRRGNMTAGQ